MSLYSTVLCCNQLYIHNQKVDICFYKITRSQKIPYVLSINGSISIVTVVITVTTVIPFITATTTTKDLPVIFVTTSTTVPTVIIVTNVTIVATVNTVPTLAKVN